MYIEIESRFTNDGREYITWSLYDGPDGIEHVQGYATDLITTFTKLLEWRERIAEDYVAMANNNMGTSTNFTANNETDTGTAN